MPTWTALFRRIRETLNGPRAPLEDQVEVIILGSHAEASCSMHSPSSLPILGAANSNFRPMYPVPVVRMVLSVLCRAHQAQAILHLGPVGCDRQRANTRNWDHGRSGTEHSDPAPGLQRGLPESRSSFAVGHGVAKVFRLRIRLGCHIPPKGARVREQKPHVTLASPGFAQPRLPPTVCRHVGATALQNLLAWPYAPQHRRDVKTGFCFAMLSALYSRLHLFPAA